MSNYISWDQTKIEDFSEDNITSFYANGYVFGRINKGNMNKTRSIRVNLSDFELNSENRRVLRKIEGLEMSTLQLPMSENTYDWHIHKLAKDFYDNKFGKGIFTASKVKQLITDAENSNFNYLFKYEFQGALVGYCIAYSNTNITHYTYPFYDFTKFENNFGMGMMLNAILWAQGKSNQYIYLGSAKDYKDKYKLQFNNLEWFDGEQWQTDLDELKSLLTPLN